MGLVQWSNAGGSWKVTPTGRGTYGRLYLQGIGHLSVKLHRRFEVARPVKLVVRRRLRGWEATVFYRGVPIELLPPTGRAAGVDVGVVVLAADAGAPSGKSPGFTNASASSAARTPTSSPPASSPSTTSSPSKTSGSAA